MTSGTQQQIEEIIESATDEGIPPNHGLSVEGARRAFANTFEDKEESPPVGDKRDLLIPGRRGEVPVRLYRPDSDPPFPILVYFHGGGWVRGNLDTHDALCSDICNRVGCIVVAVDYRRAPEHPFPAAVCDAYDATEWAYKYADAIHGDRARIAVGGDSAGGNLAAVTAILARDRGDIPLVHQLLLCPATNHDFDTESYKEKAEGYLVTTESMRWYWDQYLADDMAGYNPLASPLREPDLSGLPPAMVVTAEFDPLRDDGRAYARRLEDADVPVVLKDYEGVIHGTYLHPEVDHAEQERADMASELERVFSVT